MASPCQNGAFVFLDCKDCKKTALYEKNKTIIHLSNCQTHDVCLSMCQQSVAFSHAWFHFVKFIFWKCLLKCRILVTRWIFWHWFWKLFFTAYIKWTERMFSSSFSLFFSVEHLGQYMVIYVQGPQYSWIQCTTGETSPCICCIEHMVCINRRADPQGPLNVYDNCHPKHKIHSKHCIAVMIRHFGFVFSCNN